MLQPDGDKDEYRICMHTREHVYTHRDIHPLYFTESI